MDVFEEAVRLRRSGRKCALATIVQVNGSIPSYESAKLLVREDGSMIGTIGGGCVEAEVWSAAREVLETEKAEAWGLDAVWFSETAHDPFLAAALAAQSTSRIAIGTAIALAFTRSP